MKHQVSLKLNFSNYRDNNLYLYKESLTKDLKMLLKFYGVRGSTPTPFPEFIHYGGNTACVSCLLDQETLLIFDAGTGLKKLGDDLIARAPSFEHVKICHIFISHTHLDHINGLPFFKPLWQGGVDICFHEARLANDETMGLEETLRTRLICPPLFPVTLDNAQAKISFKTHSIDAKIKLTPKASLCFCPLNHPGHATGVRLDFGDVRICYLSDHEATQEDNQQTLINFAKKANLIILDTMYSEEDYKEHVGWGHSTYRFAHYLLQESGAQELALFHHSPDYSDKTIDKYSKFAIFNKKIFFAREASCFEF